MAYSERYVDNATGSNLNGGFPIGGIYPVTSTNGAYTQGGGAGGTDRFTAAAGTPFSGCAVNDLVSSYADGAAAPTGFVGVITAVNGGGASIDISLTAIAGTRPTTAASGRTATVGGAWAGPSGSTAFPWNFITAALMDSSSNPVRVNIKGGTTYNITAALTHGTTSNGPIFWEGYTSAVGDGGFAYFNGDSASPAAPYVMLTVSATGNFWKNLWFDDNGGVGSGQSVGNNTMVDFTGATHRIERCRFTNAYRSGLRIGAAGCAIVECEAYGNQRDDANAFGQFQVLEESFWLRCISHSATSGTDSSGFFLGSDNLEPVSFVNCIAYNTGGDCWELSGNHHCVYLYGCVAMQSGEDGMFCRDAIATASVIVAQNCLFIDNAGWGVSMNNSGHRSGPIVQNCAFWSNGSGEVNSNINSSFVSGSITLSGDPFVNAAQGNFALNNTAGAGAAVRNAGLGNFLINSSILSAGTTSYPDVGAAQHDDAGSSGGPSSFAFA